MVRFALAEHDSQLFSTKKRVNSSLDKEINRKPYVFERLDA